MIKLIIYLLLTTGGMILFKYGSQDFTLGLTKSALSFNVSYLAVLGLVFYIGSFLLWLFILKEGDLSVIYPILSSLVIVLTTLAGIFLFGEEVTLMKIVGIAVILVGVICVNYGK